MPRDSHPGRVGLRVERLYRTMLDKECQRQEGPDPRLFLNVETESQGEEWEQRKAGGRRLAALALGERLAMAEPIPLVRWQLSARTVPQVRDWPPYADRIYQRFIVTAGDVVRPL